MSESIIVMVKPWSIQHAESILSELDKHGKRRVVVRVDSLPFENLLQHYQDQSKEQYFLTMVRDMAGKPAVLALYEGDRTQFDKVKDALRLKHELDIPPHSSYQRNALHTSATEKEYQRELGVWSSFFRKEETTRDIKYLTLAIEEAKKAVPHNGYIVGAVIVLNDEVVSQAHNEENKEFNHAEAWAIKQCKDACGATLYVTMEPCDQRKSGRKSCCDFIVESGIVRVVYGVQDPDTYLKCRGIERLHVEGIITRHETDLEERCKLLTPALPFA
ncbi:hypothetical protein HY489_01440 [Candidatus Woesearchaeota archaeon]|nr:hypothetical protein [Candidatus Woesearchaeota archaeon]